MMSFLLNYYSSVFNFCLTGQYFRGKNLYVLLEGDFTGWIPFPMPSHQCNALTATRHA